MNSRHHREGNLSRAHSPTTKTDPPPPPETQTEGGTATDAAKVVMS